MKRRLHDLSKVMLPLRFWIAVVTAITVVRLGAAFSLGPKEPPFAGDEATYAGLLSAMATRESFVQWGSGFSLQLYPASRAFLWPAHILTNWGLDPFYALRVTSISYALCLGLLASYLVYIVSSDGRLSHLNLIPIASRQSLALLLLISWPSLNAWYVVGLKESTSQFWVLLSIGSLAIAMTTKSWRIRLATLLTAVVAIGGVYQVRDYLATVVVVTGALGILGTLLHRKHSIKPVLPAAALGGAALILGSILGMHLSQPLTVPRAEAGAITNLDGTSRTVSEEGSLQPPKLRPYTQFDSSIPSALESAAISREALAEGANTAIPSECGESAPRSDRLICELNRLPTAFPRIAASPLFGFGDVTSGSSSLLFASIENYLWLLLYLWFVLTVVMRKSLSPPLTLMLVTLSVLTLVGLTLYGGNIGTAFRHKSQILPLLLVAIAISGKPRWKLRSTETTASQP